MKKFLHPSYIRKYALGAGLAGLALRVWLLTTGLEANGLLRPGHPANPLTFLLTGALLVLLFVCTRPIDGIGAYHQVFPRSSAQAVGCFTAAAGVLIADVLEFVARPDYLTVISCIFGLLAAVSYVFLGRTALQHKRPSPRLHGSITLYLMLHLVSQYRFWSAEPQLQNYFFQLLASVLLMLCAYHRTAVDYSRNNRQMYLFFNYAALFACCLALPGQDWLFYLSMAVWTLGCNCSPKAVKQFDRMYLPEDALYCIQRLTEAGYPAYAVGGCVRDAILGIRSNDYDICTAATPEQTATVFANHQQIRSGEKHGTIGIVLHSGVYEITTFRAEGGYSDSRHPDWVRYVPSICEDLARRDFTINAMAYNPESGFIDLWDGKWDLQDKVLRAVGNPQVRFAEDALRILRGIRFSAQLQLTPEPETMDAMIAFAPNLSEIARERVYAELRKFLIYATAEDLLRFTPILVHAIPELAPMVDFCQHNPHHAYDVYTHTAHTIAALPPDPVLRFAALLHDVGKPVTFTQDADGKGHFYGHAQESAQIADGILQQLRAPNALREQVVLLIEHHMDSFEPDKKLLRRKLSKYGYDTTRKLLQLQQADCAGKGVEETAGPEFAQILELLEQLQAEDTCLSVKNLAVTGNDILQLGTTPGPHIGRCMSFLLDLVQDEVLSNTSEELLQAARQFLDDEKEEQL